MKILSGTSNLRLSKEISKQLKELSAELDDAIKENPDRYLEAAYSKPAASLSYKDVIE